MVSFHIEPTSKCTLECPLCDRTWFYETFKKRFIDFDDSETRFAANSNYLNSFSATAYQFKNSSQGKSYPKKNLV